MTSILNLARLQRKLDRLPKITKTLIRSRMEEQADTIVAMMKSLAPEMSGELIDSIGWTWGKLPDGSSVVAAVKSSLGGDMTITIYAGDEVAYYAGWQEFGTQNMPAHPYFFVSWRANKKGANRAVRAATRQAAKQVAGGS
jgi:HK97 gp10 family phage protein